MDDIPEVLRDRQNSRKKAGRSSSRSSAGGYSPKTTPTKSKSKAKSKLSSVLLSTGVLLILLAIAVTVITSLLRPPAQNTQSTSSTKETTPTQAKQTETTQARSAAKTKPDRGQVDNVLGHLPYPEAPESELKAITSDGGIRLRSAAAEQFQQMQAAARDNGIILVPISGFRSIKDQDNIFFKLKEERGQAAPKRAEVSAPPGYSEHHTGYAVDIGDGKVPATNLNQNFEETEAFRWLQKNAPRYNFEISFTTNNSQGVSYEPWHWRFVGDRQSLETFYKAKTLQNSKDNK
jgi:D-alanyl-D-alanine carboxypeptidase